MKQKKDRSVPTISIGNAERGTTSVNWRHLSTPAFTRTAAQPIVDWQISDRLGRSDKRASGGKRQVNTTPQDQCRLKGNERWASSAGDRPSINIP